MPTELDTLDISDPVRQYTTGVLERAGNPRERKQKAVEDPLEEFYQPTQANMTLGNARNLLGQISPNYRAAMMAQRGLTPMRQPEDTSPLMYSPNPDMAKNVPIVGKNVSLDDIRGLIRQKESGGDYTTFNKEGKSKASGAYQYVPSTWNGYGGYAQAAFAPPAVQDAKMNEDLAKRIRKYNGDAFKVLADHYLPAQANRPDLWGKPSYVGKTKVGPVAEYISYVVKGTNLEGAWNEYSGKRK